MAIIEKNKTNGSNDVEKLEPLNIPSENVKWCGLGVLVWNFHPIKNSLCVSTNPLIEIDPPKKM